MTEFSGLPAHKELALRIAQNIKSDGVTATAIKTLNLIRISQPTEPIHMVHQPALCIIVQGQKQVLLNDEVYAYNPSNYLVVSVDLPLAGQVTQASPEEPFLCLCLDLDPKEISELMMSTRIPVEKSSVPPRGLFLGDGNDTLLEAVLRMTRLLDNPTDIPVLAPMIMREIIYRLLQDKHGTILRQIALAGSQAKHIAIAIETIRRDYRKTLRIDQLARQVNMSPSSLHTHFKAVTAMSPLQFQKQLRLQEARRLLFGGDKDAATAGHLVGYESPSQFSREYRRMFGEPPNRDANRLRSQKQYIGYV